MEGLSAILIIFAQVILGKQNLTSSFWWQDRLKSIYRHLFVWTFKTPIFQCFLFLGWIPNKTVRRGCERVQWPNLTIGIWGWIGTRLCDLERIVTTEIQNLILQNNLFDKSTKVTKHDNSKTSFQLKTLQPINYFSSLNQNDTNIISANINTWKCLSVNIQPLSICAWKRRAERGHQLLSSTNTARSFSKTWNRDFENFRKISQYDDFRKFSTSKNLKKWSPEPILGPFWPVFSFVRN